jgi:hypothetical protein
VAKPVVKGGWASGPGERYGQVCDPWRRDGDTQWPPETEPGMDGCVVVWISDRGDPFTVGDLPAEGNPLGNQQNGFQVSSIRTDIVDASLM